MTRQIPAEVLTLEVGGTTLRAGVLRTSTHELIRRTAVATPNHLDQRQDIATRLLGALSAAASEVAGEQPPAVVGLAFPGPVDECGVALAAPTVLGATGPLPIADQCRSLWPGARLTVINDLTAAGHRYVSCGLSDFCLITVGSGIGHKVFVGGRPLLGARARGGEIGHLRVDPSRDAPRCDCGGKGHLGGIASGRGTLALLRRTAVADSDGFRASSLARSAIERITNEQLVTAFHDGDAWVVQVVGRAAIALAHAIAGIHLATGVELFILTGGYARALGEPYRRLLVAAAADECWDLGHDWDAMIEFGIPDDDSGLIGAALAALGAGSRP